MALRTSIIECLKQHTATADSAGVYDVSVLSVVALITALYNTEKLQLLNIFATDQRSEGVGLCMYYSLGEPTDGALLTIRIKLGDATEFPSVVDAVHEASWYEREIYTMFGLVPQGHPNTARTVLHENWPAGVFPLRKDFAWDTRPEIAHEIFEFSKIEGEGIFEVPVGPIHAGIIEPGHFRFSMAGEEILQLEPRLGYVHKGIEKLFETVSLEEKVKLAERISGDSSVGHCLAFCQAVESLSDVAVPPRAQYLRALLLEMERLSNHVHDIGFIMLGTAYNFGSSQFSRIRERVMQLNEQLTSSRYMRGMVVLGGVSRDIDDKTLADVRTTLASIRKDFEEVIHLCQGNITMINRMEGSGTLDLQTAIDHGVIGIPAKALGIAHDARKDFPSNVYKDLEFEVPLQTAGDVNARWMIRVLEIPQVFSLLDQIIEKMPSGSIKVEVPMSLPAGKVGYGIVEGFRGTIVHTILTDNTGAISRVQVRDPSFVNWHVFKYAAKGAVLLDFPLINKSFNLSYSGHDR